MNAESIFGFCCIALSSQTLGGCTVIGLGTGVVADVASAPKYETVPPASAPRIWRGEDVVLHAKDGTRTEGRLLGAARTEPSDPETYLLVEEWSGVTMVRQSELRVAAVEQPKRAWLYGGAIGLGLDVLTLALFAAFYDQSYSAHSWSSSSSTGGW